MREGQNKTKIKERRGKGTQNPMRLGQNKTKIKERRL
jgi:hypothetical protein